MFSGIIEGMGGLVQFVRTGQGGRLTVSPPQFDESPRPGDSVSVDGACLTVERRGAAGLEFELSRETLARTRFARLGRGARLNLERALRAGSRIGGHFVTGHVDGMAAVRRMRRFENSTEVEFSAPRGFEELIVEKGSVAINGVSLTVAARTTRTFRVALIPYTLRSTNLADLAPGDSVHFEADMLGKYVVQYLRSLPRGSLSVKGRISRS